MWNMHSPSEHRAYGEYAERKGSWKSWKSWKIPRQSRVSFRVRLAYSWRRSAVINSPENANKRDKGSARQRKRTMEGSAFLYSHAYVIFGVSFYLVDQWSRERERKRARIHAHYLYVCFMHPFPRRYPATYRWRGDIEKKGKEKEKYIANSHPILCVPDSQTFKHLTISKLLPR